MEIKATAETGAVEWVAHVSFVPEGGHLVVSRLTIEPAQKGVPVPRRGINVTVVRAVLRSPPMRPRKVEGVRVVHHLGISPATLPLLPQARPKAGRRPIPLETLLDVAVAYAKATEAESRRPVADAAQALELGPERVRDLVHRARRRGLLNPAAWGKGGGGLTAEGNRLLAARAKATPKRGRRRKGAK